MYTSSDHGEPTMKTIAILCITAGLASAQCDRACLNKTVDTIFKIRDGKIHEIEANGFSLPYNSKTGWE